MKQLSSRGQGSVELVLTVFILLLVAALISKGVRRGQFISTLINTPWTQLTGIIENGTWGPAQRTRSSHPGYFRRHISILGEKI